MLTIREVLADVDVALLAGEANVDMPVRWVHISELPDPTPWLSGGELLLTTGLALDTPKHQREYIATLADHGLAGLGLGTGFTHDKVPKALVEAARERDFPLFEVPYELPFIALTEKAFTRLVNEQYALLQRSIAAQERLQRIVLSERGLDAIVGALATLIGGPALVFDGRGELQAMRTFRRELDPEVVAALGEEVRERARRGDGRGFVPGHPDLAPRALALPIASGDPPRTAAGAGALPQAWLVAAKDSDGLAEIDRLILHQAVTVVALELLRRRVADSTERRLAGDVLSAVIAGELEGADLGRRLEPFGLGGRVTALVLSPPERTTPEACEAALTEALRGEAVSGLVAPSGRYVVALLPGFLDDELFELAERAVAGAGQAVGGRPAAGVGRAVPAGRAREAYHEARCALEARELGSVPPTNGNGAHAPTVATYRDLGSFQLLLSLQDTDALRLFCESLLGPIEHGEGHYGGELMRSLEAFIECNGQWEAAARRLYCHRHTLRYRIRKIEELTGRDLSSARDRIEFWLALRGREIVLPSPRRQRGPPVKVGVPTEIKTDEYRVALTPSGVRELTDRGHEVVVQAGAGEGSAISDADYVAQGAQILPDAEAVFGEADLIVKVKEPQPEEVARLQPRHTLFTYLHLAPDPEQTQGLLASGATAIAYETVEDARGRLPLLAPMSEVAGKIATQAGAFMLEKPMGGRGLLLGGVPGVAAGKVMVIGGGVVGQNAAEISVGLGGETYVYDRSIDRLRELEVLLNGRVSTCFASTLEIESRLPEMDLVIGAVLVHGATAPRVITREQLKLMKRNAVLVDVSIDQGGCFETSRPTTHSDPTYQVDGITHYCVANMPGAVPITSTWALTNATMPYLRQARRRGRAPRAGRRPGLHEGPQRGRRQADLRAGRARPGPRVHAAAGRARGGAHRVEWPPPSSDATRSSRARTRVPRRPAAAGRGRC